MQYPFKVILFLIFCMHATLASADGVYRWVDEKGVVHYSDRASSSGAKSVEVKPAPTSGTSAPSAASSDTKTKDAATNDRSTAVRADQCEKAKSRLENYRAADQLLITDSEGAQREMSADEKIEAILRAEKQTQSFCQG